MQFFEALRSLDWIAAAAAILLMLIGLAAIFSSTYTEQTFTGLFIRQAVAGLVAIGLFFLLAFFPYHSLRRYTAVVYGVGVIGLLTVGVLGQVIRGTISRLSIFGVQIQPSEFMKIGLVLVLAWLFAQHKQIGWKNTFFSAVLVGLPTALIMLEPDIGVAGLIILMWGSLLIFLGLPWRAILMLGALSLVVVAAAWHWLFLDYQKDRFLTFLDPTRDPLGAGYNVVQSIVALGSGQVFGRGLGHGPQSQLKFLPEQHTDFIMASLGEELGFVGVAVVISLYLVLLWRILKIATSTQDRFGQILCAGTFLILIISFVVSAGMNMGLLPVTGIPLPLVSYGGSNLVTTFMLLGMVQSVQVYSRWVQAPPMEISHIT